MGSRTTHWAAQDFPEAQRNWSGGGREKTGAGHTGPKAKVNDHPKAMCIRGGFGAGAT